MNLRIVWVDDSDEVVDVSGYTAALKVKQYYDSASALVSLTDSDGIALAASSPNITISRTAAQAAAYDWTRALYDLELTTGGVTTRLLQGFVRLRKEVTA